MVFTFLLSTSSLESYLFSYFSSCIYIFFIINKKKEELQFIRQPWNLALNLIFLILFLKSKRHFPLFFIVSFPSLVTILWSGIKNIFSNIKFNHNGKIDIFKNLYYHQHYNFWNGYTSENEFSPPRSI